jgi:spore coat protein U-like protein
MKISIRLITAGLLALGLPLAASAQSITINASVNSQCNLANQTVSLGALNLLTTPVTKTGTNLTLTCNKNATVTLALGEGNNFTTTRRMKSATTAEFIDYQIARPTIGAGVATCPALPATEWDSTNILTAGPLFTASGGPKSIPICVYVPAPQFPSPANDYTDVVVVTVTTT